MKKYIFILFLSCIVVLNAKAQFSAGYSVGYGSYQMDDMKQVLKNMLNELRGQLPDIPVAVVDNFPGYVTHSLDLGYRIKNNEIGLRGTYLTTGGNVAYSDYSGEYSGKLTLNGFRIGLNYRYYIPATDFGKLGSLSLFAELSPGITFSKLKSKEYIRIFDQQENSDEDLNLNANGISLLPQIGAKWFINNRIGVHIGAGYDFQLGSHFTYQGVKSTLKSDWSGIRINAGVSVTL